MDTDFTIVFGLVLSLFIILFSVLYALLWSLHWSLTSSDPDANGSSSGSWIVGFVRMCLPHLVVAFLVALAVIVATNASGHRLAEFIAPTTSLVVLAAFLLVPWLIMLCVAVFGKRLAEGDRGA
jgi:hypothetical protein